MRGMLHVALGGALVMPRSWSVLRSKGFEWQFEGRFKHVHLDQTATMVGRALRHVHPAAPRRTRLQDG
jgi:hypothetical protein